MFDSPIFWVVVIWWLLSNVLGSSKRRRMRQAAELPDEPFEEPSGEGGFTEYPEAPVEFQSDEPLAEELEMIGEVRGKGLMIGIELVGPDGEPAPEKASAALEAAREEGLLIGKGGLYGNALRIAPPLSITEEEADDGLARLERALRRI